MADLKEMLMAGQITVSKLKCLRCLREWYPKPGRGRPDVCSGCKSYDWDKPRQRPKIKRNYAPKTTESKRSLA